MNNNNTTTAQEPSTMQTIYCHNCATYEFAAAFAAFGAFCSQHCMDEYYGEVEPVNDEYDIDADVDAISLVDEDYDRYGDYDYEL